MRIDEYLSRYEKYRRTYNHLKRAGKRRNVFGETIRYEIGRQQLEEEIKHRERVLRYATARIETAISRMESVPEANYIMCKYFYGMKNLEFAETFNYCERHVYRLAASAKKNLYRELVKLMPKPCRGERGKRYRYSTRIKKQAV